MIVGNSSSLWSELNVGASNSFLSTDGTDAFWGDTLNASKVTATTITDSTLSINSGNLTGANLLSFATASGSANLEVASAGFSNLTVTSGLSLPANSITETMIDINTAPQDNYLLYYNSAAGKLDYVTSTASWDTNTTYTFNNPLSLVGTAVSIDYASASGGGYLTADNFNDLFGHMASVNAHIDWTAASSSFFTTGTFNLDNTASISGNLTSYGTISGQSLTDGTATLTGGNWTGIGSLSATTGSFIHASVSDDFESLNANLSSVSIATLNLTRASVSDSLTVGDILKGGTITDGTATLTAGNLTGAGSLAFNYASAAQDFAVGNSLFYVNAGSSSRQFGGTGTASFAGQVAIGTYTLPNTDGSSNQVLKTDGSGVLSWQNDSTSAGGDSVAHGLLNPDAHTDVAIASASRGSLIVENSSSLWSELNV